MLTVTELGTILGVWAHPDDEAYLSAGLMAAAVDAGQRVVCVTATRGGLGGDEAERTAELAASLAVVGVTEHHWLPYRDGHCADIPDRYAVPRIAALIRAVRPDTVVTFGPEGMTGHPDHRAISRWTVAAFGSAAPPGARLLLATKTAQYVEQVGPLYAPYDVFGPGTPPRTVPADLAVDHWLAGAALERKVAALTAQRSQTAGLIAALGPVAYAGAVVEECFVLAAVGPV